jgi:hypothetical protein
MRVRRRSHSAGQSSEKSSAGGLSRRSPRAVFEFIPCPERGNGLCLPTLIICEGVDVVGRPKKKRNQVRDQVGRIFVDLGQLSVVAFLGINPAGNRTQSATGVSLGYRVASLRGTPRGASAIEPRISGTKR